MAALSPFDAPNLKDFESRGALKRHENRVDPDHNNGAKTGLNRGLWVRSAFESSQPSTHPQRLCCVLSPDRSLRRFSSDHDEDVPQRFSHFPPYVGGEVCDAHWNPVLLPGPPSPLRRRYHI